MGYFCKGCGNRLIHEFVGMDGEVDGRVSVTIGCLDGLGKEDYKGAVHIWTSVAVSDIPEGVERYEEDAPDE